MISHANWLWNCLSLSDVSIIGSKTSHEAWFNDQKSNLHHIKIFESLISVYMSIKTGRAKLDKKIFDSIFIDYQSEVTNHWVWNSINQKIIWSLFVEMFKSWKDSKLLSILGSEWQWEYQINLVISDSDNEILELSFSVKVSLNTSTTSSHHLIASEHEDVVVISRIDDSDKCLNQNEENNRNSFENSNAEESEIISS